VERSVGVRGIGKRIGHCREMSGRADFSCQSIRLIKRKYLFDKAHFMMLLLLRNDPGGLLCRLSNFG
jgi:hypothetical protein